MVVVFSAGLTVKSVYETLKIEHLSKSPFSESLDSGAEMFNHCSTVRFKFSGGLHQKST